MAVPSHEAQLLFICGDQSGAGKTSTCIGILNELIHTDRFKASELAYIKPCTQCEGVQLLWKFCAQMGIHCVGIGPIVYKSGYTQECIDGEHGTPEDRLAIIETTINSLKLTYKFIIIDGVGYPGVGSCIGCSNRDVAKLLQCPVLMVSRPGVGNMIDSCVMNIEYMAYHDVVTIGTIVNKIPQKVSYHTIDKIKEYTTKFFSTYRYTTSHGTKQHSIRIYAHIPSYQDDSGSCAVSCATSCALKPNVDIKEFDLEMDDADYIELSKLLKLHHKNVNYTELFDDITAFYSTQLQKE